MNLRNIADVEDALNSGGISSRDLHAVWEQRLPIADPAKQKDRSAPAAEAPQIPWLQGDISLARQFTARALEKEEFLLVCDAAREALRLWPGANEQDRLELLRVRIDHALALARLGFTRDARRELEPCVADDFQPRLGRKLKAEILMHLGEILREEFHHATERAVRRQIAGEALEFSARALSLDPSNLDALIFTATASFVLGEPGSEHRAQSAERARELRARIARIEDDNGPQLHTTRAQAISDAILGDTDAAARRYGELQAFEGATVTYLAEARYRSQFLAEALGKPRDFFRKAFPPLQMIIFAGHLPDRPGGCRRFPHGAVEETRRILKAKLDELDVRTGISSAAAGADLLFIDALRARKGNAHIVLPWSQEEFRKTSIRPFEPPGAPPFWEPLLDRLTGEAATVRRIGQEYQPSSDVGWTYAMEVAAGIAVHMARVSRLDLQPMVLWDGQPGPGPGGTAAFAEFWRQDLRCDPIVVGMPSAPPSLPRELQEGRSQRSERSTVHQEVKSMLFADIVGYSKLTENVIPEFVGTFLDRVSQLAAESKNAPRSVNTWGDAVFAVFDFAHEAGAFALELTQMIENGERDWLQKGLYWEEDAGDGKPPAKRPLRIRTGLHTGPVFMHYDPIVRRLGFTGAQVSRAARIEPVAKPGEIYASEEFAALAGLADEIARRSPEGGKTAGFICEFAGTMALAKGFPGRHRIYRVVPNRSFELEELAKVAHEAYLEEAQARGETPASNSSIRPWEELSEDLRDANRAQIADIPNKLRLLGYELSPANGIAPSEIEMPGAKLEELSIREHDRWMKDRQRNGWTFGPVRDNARKHHPSMIPWEALSESEKEKDRDTLRNLPRLIAKAGFRLRKIQ